MQPLTSEGLLNFLPKERLLSIIDDNPNLRGILTGYIAEEELIRRLETLPGFTSVTKIRDHDSQRGDLLVTYLDKTFTIEVKCIKSRKHRENVLAGGLTFEVLLKTGDAETLPDGTRIFYQRSDAYDVLAICTLTIGGNCDYYFLHSKYIPRADDYPDRFVTTAILNTINTPCLRYDIHEVIQDLS